MTYAVHTRLVETQDCKDMMELYPTPAVYGDFYLFAQPHANPKQPVVDMTALEDLVEFDTAYSKLLSEEHTGRWIHLTYEQGHFLLEKYFTPEEVL